MKRLLVTAHDVGSTGTDIRLLMPLGELEARGAIGLRARSFWECGLDDLEWADVLIVQRGNSKRVLRLIELMQSRSGRVVYDIDDLITTTAPHLLHVDAMRSRVRWVERCLSRADVVAASTELLGERIAPLARRWVHLPNYAWPEPVPATRLEGPASLVIASSDRMGTPFLYEPLRRLLAERGSALQLVCIGPPAEQYEALGLPITKLPLLPRGEFLARVRALSSPLALIPLDESEFSSCKSAVKFFDYAAAGIPSLCSRVSPYREVVQHGRTGWLVENSEQAWDLAIRKVLDDEAVRQAVVAAAAADVRAHFSLEQTLDAWTSLLQTLPSRDPRRRIAPWRRGVEQLLLTVRHANRKRLQRRDAAS